jgi:hypothetical protein
MSDPVAITQADLTPTAAADWTQPGWLVAIGLRALLKDCRDHIAPLVKEHETAASKAKKDGAVVPSEPVKLVHLQQQQAILEKLLAPGGGAVRTPDAEGPTLSIAIAVAWTVVAAAAWFAFGLDPDGTEIFSDSRQFVLVSMAIALGTYFATVVRELKIRRSRASGGSRTALLRDIRYIRAGEYLVVVLGLLSLLRIVAPTFPEVFGTRGLTPAQADAGLVLLLAAVILHAIILHVREWFFR